MDDCCSITSKRRPADNNDARLKNMVFVGGGTFRTGSDNHYAEEAPSHRVAVDGFWIDATPVTNVQFRKLKAPRGIHVPTEDGISGGDDHDT